MNLPIYAYYIIAMVVLVPLSMGVSLYFHRKNGDRFLQENPDASKRNRTLEGIDFVSDFTYNEKTKKYENGKIYDPSTGKSYACFMELQSDGSLKVRGHLAGFKAIGKTQIWRKYK